MTLCIGLLSLGITVYEESIVMNGSEFLSSVHTWHLRLSSSTECCSFSLSPIQLALSSLSLCSGRYSSLLRPSPLPLALAQAESASWAGWSLRGFWNFLWTTSATIRPQKMEYYIWVAESGLFGNLDSEQTNHQKLIRPNKTALLYYKSIRCK